MSSTFFPWGSWQEFFGDSVVRLTLGVIGLLVVSMFALYVLLRLRRINAHNLQIDAMVRKNFEEMRTEGDLDEQEFRKIQALLEKQRSIGSESDATKPSRSD